MKDNFSVQSGSYAAYRPSYPDALFDFLMTVVSGRRCAWDCGTGNGQVAIKLSEHFGKVYATDISPQQLQNGVPSSKIQYSLQPAESTAFADNTFDLITVAQAIHWFEFDKFYGEVKRTAKPEGILAVIGYGLPRITPVIDGIFAGFYHNTLNLYWDKERRYVDENYRTIPFPFPEIGVPAFENTVEWSFEHFIGFIRTGSAVQHFLRKNGTDPVAQIYDDLKKSWGSADTRMIDFPVLFRVGRIEKLLLP
ncbi:methyltransferase family protein [Anseongella ginsenosidimutans]|uniref:Methyltransferase family protein n=1 Tax=Anseongella ginsenosidimutans TaxID=496056 RepID=A0A4R3KMB0_9SPHI|nr:class I SAM-dependent methyltransferase [Anseongella ginsenosidimutans]QEC52687.1 class I SAM-dependent methyltransferase [Anseongella ginsenosidimutans]TCS85435.1 methyltransferase family protein [Anseongella ginsenosidimutans]